ncbi:MAG: CRISPR-associated RecB family exonuclease Cas4 [Nitrospira sp.]|jgi:CRISPR-associated exonuclease Cas4|nr:MAG: CRISPR-associated RecB family exonuclease Cas4 [Nitrospira sp.]
MTVVAEEHDPVMISALEHWSYCPRQCALIHVEQTFDENLYTLRGQAVHKRVDEPETEEQAGVRIERALPLWSKVLGLIGKADVVEFHGEMPYPVEYKHGPHREKEHDDLQLCAQALCLEEMTGKPVPRGAIYHHSSRRRREVMFTRVLRDRVAEVVTQIRSMVEAKTIPPPVNDHRCAHCSLSEACMPSVIGERQRAEALVRTLFIVQDPS